MEFVIGELPRFGFGFANPNHAAAAICAAAPFLWGWRRCRWLGWGACAALVVMLALTFSRTGFVVLAAEALAWWWMGRRSREMPDPSKRARGTRAPAVVGCVIAMVVIGAALWWMGPRLKLDGAILNRPKIWLAGIQLIAANPFGVGFGNSGKIASAFLLPEGIDVRTLVNSHLTLVTEMGVVIGGVWLAFIAMALTGIRQLPRTGIAFSGLVISACSASVFDGPVLFDFADDGGYGLVNFVLSWGLLLAFLGMGIALTVRGVRGAHGVIALPSGLAAVVLAVLPFLVPTTGVPRVERGWVRYGAGGPQLLL